MKLQFQLVIVLGLFLIIVCFAAYNNSTVVGNAAKVQNAQISCNVIGESCHLGCCAGSVCSKGVCRKPCVSKAICTAPTTSQVTQKSCQVDVFRCKLGCDTFTGRCR